jgi:hypothetical protein
MATVFFPHDDLFGDLRPHQDLIRSEDGHVVRDAKVLVEPPDPQPPSRIKRRGVSLHTYSDPVLPTVGRGEHSGPFWRFTETTLRTAGNIPRWISCASRFPDLARGGRQRVMARARTNHSRRTGHQWQPLARWSYPTRV